MMSSADDRRGDVDFATRCRSFSQLFSPLSIPSQRLRGTSPPPAGNAGELLFADK
jgi:hypothetical protein